MAFEADAMALISAVQGRLVQLLMAPLDNQSMLWAAIPLLIATIFISLYFGRHSREDIGWNSAFENSMVFLFVAISLIKEMYSHGGSWQSVFSNSFYMVLTIALVFSSIMLMTITYFHLMPRRVAFFLFSAPPVNVTAYIVMTMIYTHAPPDIITALAGLVFLGIIIILMRVLQFIVRVLGFEEIEDEDTEVKACADHVEDIAEKVEIEIEKRKARRSKAASGRKA